MTTRIYKIMMRPEDIDGRVAYMIDRTDEPPITEENAGDAFDCVLSDNDGYVLESFEEVAEVPTGEHPYEVG